MLTLHLTDENVSTAVQSNSGACLIADAIRREYPFLTSVAVDMATIRVTDRKRGERYTYLTPAVAQHVLLSFDQGWPNPVDSITVRGAVKVNQVTASSKGSVERRASRKRDLEAAERRGEPLSRTDKAALTRMRNEDQHHPPRTEVGQGPAELVEPTRRERSAPVVVGGPPLVMGKPHPNLLRGRNRHFGAKLADPGQAFHEPVERARAEHRARQGAATPADPQQESDTGAAANGA